MKGVAVHVKYRNTQQSRAICNTSLGFSFQQVVRSHILGMLPILMRQCLERGFAFEDHTLAMMAILTGHQTATAPHPHPLDLLPKSPLP